MRASPREPDVRARALQPGACVVSSHRAAPGAACRASGTTSVEARGDQRIVSCFAGTGGASGVGEGCEPPAACAASAGSTSTTRTTPRDLRALPDPQPPMNVLFTSGCDRSSAYARLRPGATMPDYRVTVGPQSTFPKRPVLRSMTPCAIREVRVLDGARPVRPSTGRLSGMAWPQEPEAVCSSRTLRVQVVRNRHRDHYKFLISDGNDVRLLTRFLQTEVACAHWQF